MKRPQGTGWAIGQAEDGSKMARGGQEGAVGGLEGDTSLLLLRRAKAHGTEGGAFKAPGS